MSQENAYGRIFKEVLAALREETDRGCVLVGAAYLDDALEEKLRARLSIPSDVKKKIFEHNGPLGTFSGKIEIAYCVGLLQPSLRRNLHLLRKIRNDFAHKKFTRAFDDAEVAKRLGKIFLGEREYLAVGWATLQKEVAILRDADDPAVQADADRFVEKVGARGTFEIFVSHIVASFESGVETGTTEKLEALPEKRTY